MTTNSSSTTVGMNGKDKKWGKLCLIIPIILLVSLAISYWVLHNGNSFSKDSRESVIDVLSVLIEDAKTEAEKAQGEKDSAKKAEKIKTDTKRGKTETNIQNPTTETEPSDTVKGLVSIVTRIKSIWLANSRYMQTMGDQDKKVFSELITMVDTSMGNKDYKGMSAGLTTMDNFCEETYPKGWFWIKGSGRFLEIMMWGMAGILVNLIYTTGEDLKKESFSRRIFIVNLAYIITIPILTLVFLFFVSQVKLTITNNMEIDISDPCILVALSFTVGLFPKVIKDNFERMFNKSGG